MLLGRIPRTVVGSALAVAALSSCSSSAETSCAANERLRRWDVNWNAGRYSKAGVGFHKGEVNQFLQAWQEDWLGGLQNGRIAVPLCGKTLDLPYLASFGHEVVGVEGVRRAIDEFGQESNIKLTARQVDVDVSLWESASLVAIAEGDFFAVSPAQIGTFDRIVSIR